MKKLLSLALGILVVLSTQEQLFVQAETSKETAVFRDLPDYIWEYAPQENNSKIVTDTEIVGPSQGVYSRGGSILVKTSGINNKSVDVSFSLSFGFASVSTTLPIGDCARNSYVGTNVKIPGEGYYVIKVTSRVKVTPNRSIVRTDN